MAGGYAFVVSGCVYCRKLFFYNPLTVPSTSKITGSREPICQNCMQLINAKRIAAGLSPFVIDDNAYEAIPEEELP